MFDFFGIVYFIITIKQYQLELKLDKYSLSVISPSVHSWLGVLTMTVFCLTYVFSAILFNPYLKFIKPSIRMAAKPFHIS